MSVEGYRGWEGESVQKIDPEVLELERDARVIEAVANALRARKTGE